MLEFFLLAMLLGLVAGVLAGLFGLGGGVIIVPVLVWLFTEQQFPESVLIIMAVATSLATIILTSFSSLLSHHKLGNIIWPRVLKLVPGIIVGSILGAKLANGFESIVLKWLFVSYLVYVGVSMMFPSKQKFRRSEKKVSAWMDYLAGNVIGMVSALLGIGGGSITVPYLISRQLPMRNAVAISSACGLPIAITSVVVYIYLGVGRADLPEWSLGYIYLPAFFAITLCSVITAPLGAKLADVLPSKKLKRYFSVVVFIMAIAMMLQ